MRYQTQFCRICKNSEYTPNTGYLCGLTQKIGDFESNCNDFEVDQEKYDIHFDADEKRRIKNEERCITLESKVQSLQVLVGILYTISILSTGYATYKIYTFDSYVEEATKEWSKKIEKMTEEAQKTLNNTYPVY